MECLIQVRGACSLQRTQSIKWAKVLEGIGGMQLVEKPSAKAHQGCGHWKTRKSEGALHVRDNTAAA